MPVTRRVTSIEYEDDQYRVERLECGHTRTVYAARFSAGLRACTPCTAAGSGRRVPRQWGASPFS